MAVSKFVLAVVKVPNIHPTVFSGKEENTRSSWGEATIGKISTMVSRSNDRRLKFFEPDLGGPISHREEISLIRDRSIQGINGAKMSATLQTISVGNLDIFFGFLIGSDDNTLFSPHQKLISAGLGVELQHGTSDDAFFRIDVFS